MGPGQHRKIVETVKFNGPDLGRRYMLLWLNTYTSLLPVEQFNIAEPPSASCQCTDMIAMDCWTRISSVANLFVQASVSLPETPSSLS